MFISYLKRKHFQFWKVQEKILLGMELDPASSMKISLLANVFFCSHSTTRTHFRMNIFQNTAGQTPVTLLYNVIPTHNSAFQQFWIIAPI